MKTKYYQYTIQGQHSAQAAMQALGKAASQGTLVRIDNRNGQTHVYLAAHEGAKPEEQAHAQTAGNIQVKEVAGSEISRVG